MLWPLLSTRTPALLACASSTEMCCRAVDLKALAAQVSHGWTTGSSKRRARIWRHLCCLKRTQLRHAGHSHSLQHSLQAGCLHDNMQVAERGVQQHTGESKTMLPGILCNIGRGLTRKAEASSCFWRKSSPGLLYTSPYACVLQTGCQACYRVFEVARCTACILPTASAQRLQRVSSNG